MKSAISLLTLIIIFASACNTTKEEVINEYYPSGNLMKQSVYETIKDKRELVKETRYYENGTKKLEGEYLEGERNGNWTQWYENGFTWSEGEFARGIRVGKSTVYNQDGTVHYIGFYKLGKPDGEWTFFDENEKVAKKVTYHEGQIIDEENYQVPFQ